jgi:hypothetical protein
MCISHSILDHSGDLVVSDRLMRGWIPIFEEVEVHQLVEISTLMKKASNRMNEPLQSLHHGSAGYQSVYT